MSKYIKAGQYFDTGGFLTNSFGGHPKLCTRTGKTRVYYVRVFDDKERESEATEEYCSISSVGFIADTKEEINAIREFGWKQYEEICKSTKEIKDRYKQELAVLRASFKNGVDK